ncbi:DUF4013 domain-containing protein [Methanobrevibacter millerae]|uniref:DUF4013 domain-containing protein n=1 Tax=Methanobrevibacter millerae TaxID=230361 RepID=A0A0U3E6T8_9EURY|nr:DUF4013 domain-containing protein [Methanobrevibacter millerae]ALT67976.1 hypothetical protein sm9_0167 [Methanobrevibacter millerae]
MILDIYKDSFEFSSRKVMNLIILGVLSLFNILIIPLVFFYGYNYRVVKLSTQGMINGDDVPPDFDDFKRMFIEGLKYIVVEFVYLIIPLIILVASVFYRSAILLFIALLLMVILQLFALLAIPHMAANDDSLKSAFALSEINGIMASIGYGRYILTYIGIVLIYIVILMIVTIVLSIIFGLLGIATSFISLNGVGAVNLIGTIIFNFVLFFLVTPYLTMFRNRCIGLIYNLGS